MVEGLGLIAIECAALGVGKSAHRRSGLRDGVGVGTVVGLEQGQVGIQIGVIVEQLIDRKILHRGKDSLDLRPSLAM